MKSEPKSLLVLNAIRSYRVHGFLGDSDVTSIDLTGHTGFLFSRGASGKKHKISQMKDDLQ